MMNFSEFIMIMYNAKNKTYTTQESYSKAMFNAVSTNINYTDNYFKKLLNGSKPLTNDIKELILKNQTFENLPNFFLSVTNKNRFDDLIEKFEIEKDEKKDFNIFIEAICEQFKNYIKYEEYEIPTTVNSIYVTLLDQKGNGSIEFANELALVEAKQYYILALKALSSISVNDDLLTTKGPFESFFDSIYKTYKIYEAKCNREGKNLLNQIRDKVLDNSLPKTDNYLRKITEPGANPINLIKELHFTIYDNYKFDDKDMEVSIKLFDDSEQSKIIEAFKNIKFYPTNEIFFTEKIIFSSEGSSDDLIDEALNICYRTDIILGLLQKIINKDYEMLLKLDIELDKAYKSLNASSIQYVIDGEYYPKLNKIHRAPSFKFLGEKDGLYYDPANELMKLNDHPFFKYSKSFEERMDLLINWENFIWKQSKYEDLMAELYLFTKNNTYKLIMTPVTSKARIYRLIRDAKKMVFQDQIVSFLYSTIVSVNNIKLLSKKEFLEMTSEERIKIGTDALWCYGFDGEKIYSKMLTREDSMNNKLPSNDESKAHIFIPLVRSIHAFHFFDKNWDYDKDDWKDEIKNECKEFFEKEKNK